MQSLCGENTIEWIFVLGSEIAGNGRMLERDWQFQVPRQINETRELTGYLLIELSYSRFS